MAGRGSRAAPLTSDPNLDPDPNPNPNPNPDPKVAALRLRYFLSHDARGAPPPLQPNPLP
eukprot:scaffold4653_cov50-Phaeocystis_antarctica.AAC.1